MGRFTAPERMGERVLQAHDSDEDLRWNKIEVSAPTLLWPYRSDGIIGATDIGPLLISYRPVDRVDPNAITNHWPAHARGLVYLWAPGTWWVRIAHLSRTGTTGYQTGLIHLPFAEIRSPNPEPLLAWMLDREGTRCTVSHQVISNVFWEQVLSTKEMLQGVVGLRIQANGTMFFRWEQPGNATIHFQYTNPDIWELWGERLPSLSPLWARASAAGAGTLKIERYF